MVDCARRESIPVPRSPYAALLLGAALVALSCAGRGNDDQQEPEQYFEKGRALFESEKWARAAEKFNWIVLNNPAGNLAVEAQYYYAECIYRQEQYVEAQLEFERLLRRWAGTERQAQVRYRITQCLVAQSPAYQRDQNATLDAIDELQAFIDDFPDSEYRLEAEEQILQMRMKLARKHYESGRLYLKWGRLVSARLYFDKVLAQYYDTPYADQARVGIIISHILDEDLEGAAAYHAAEKDRFRDHSVWEQAADYIQRAREEKFDLALFKRLYE